MMVYRSETDQSCPETRENFKRVLIVDDSRQNREVLAYALTSYELDVTACENATEALLKCMIGQFNYIITDYDMPGLNGIELIQRLRGKCPQTVIIGMSGSDRAAEFFEAGANDFLQKPFLLESLAMMIDGGLILS